MKETDYENKLAQLHKSYRESLNEKIIRMTFLWQEIIKNGYLSSSAEFAELMLFSHRMAGTGMIYEMPELSLSAKKLEDLLLQLNDHAKNEIDSKDIDLISKQLIHLTDVIENQYK